ncbi:PilW family protein [Ralstonia sp. SET104]|uniref:PilW family protein n=1 Tax=Ralstonia sp. SET104 TaxID=2448774 RepID=UPI000F568CBD|nr:PilW family protein [Ralstonia sp. SET104]GCB06645.1 pilus assembly protein PilW [Ralstonia sp. SET104]
MTANNKVAQRGYTLIELMVSIALGLLVTAGLVTIFVSNSRTRTELERANEQTDNGLYAMQVLTDDLRNAGYLAEFNPTPLATPAALPDPCSAVLADLKTALPIAVQGYDNGANAPSCLSDVRPGTDIVVVRRGSTCAVGDADCDSLVAGAPYFQASTCGSAAELSSGNVANYYGLDTDTTKLTLRQKDCNPPTTAGTVAPLHQYRTHIYFIANNDRSGDGIPTLKRAELGATGFTTIVPLAEGIESLQIEYGIDTASPTAGTPGVYTANPSTYGGCTGATCVGYWRNTVAAKVYLLARNKTPSAGYTGGANKTFAMGFNADGTANTAGPFNDAYRRHAYNSVVSLNNTAGRNAP